MIKNFLYVGIALLIGITVGFGFKLLENNGVYSLISPITEIEKNLPVKKEVIGFLPYWLINRTQDSYQSAITTLSYFSLSLNDDGTIQKLITSTEEEPGWTTLKKESVKSRFLQSKSQGLKTSLVVFSAEESHIDALLSDPVTHAQNLISEITPIMQEYKFDDLNLDIESLVEASASSQQQFTTFVDTVKKGLVKNNLGTLSVDMTVMSLFQSQRINPKDIGIIADRIILMTYDYHYAGSIVTGAVGPLHGGGIDRYNDVTVSIKKAQEFIAADKLLLGIPLYGYEWETLKKDLGSAVIPGTGQTASIRRVEEIISNCSTCTLGRDSVNEEAFLIYASGSAFHQISYPDRESIEKRVELITKENIRGAALWALGYEGKETLSPMTTILR